MRTPIRISLSPIGGVRKGISQNSSHASEKAYLLHQTRPSLPNEAVHDVKRYTIVLTQCTLGPKTRPTVVVVLKTTNSAMMRKAESGRSPTSSETGTPAAHVMTTLYTLRPMYLESLSAAMLTLRVSHARKQPNTYAFVRPRSTHGRELQLTVLTCTVLDWDLLKRPYSKMLHLAALAIDEAKICKNVQLHNIGAFRSKNHLKVSSYFYDLPCSVMGLGTGQTLCPLS